jgi:tRNA wybutosine-synthesizing protein 3
MNQFNQRKKDILSKKDKSSRGKWDLRIISICDKINSFENYYTTSSCSGRIIVMKDEEKKGPDLFKFVSHDLVDFDGFWKFINENCFCGGKMPTQTRTFNSETIVSGRIEHSRPPICKKFSKKINVKSNLKFKQTAVILHIACRDLESAKFILEKGLKVGFKKSGIISLGKNIIVELNLSEKLEFPLIEKGNLLVSEGFLKKVIEKANKNLEKGWKKIENLFETI